MKKLSLLLSICAIALIGTFLIVSSCKKEDDEETPPNNDELSIPETTKVIDKNTWSENFISLDSSNFTITFDSDLLNAVSISVGDIIVSPDGYGYLRKVTSVQSEGDQIKVYTVFASMTEAIENGSFTLETVLSEQKIMNINYLRQGVELDTSNIKSTEETALNYNFDTYLDNNETVHLTGSFVLLPSLNTELIIKWFKVKKLNVEFVVDEQLNIQAALELIDTYENEVELSDIDFHPITVMIGPVPVIIVPELKIYAGVNMDINAVCSTYVDQTLNYHAGLLYENSEWELYSELTKQLTYQPPSLSATATARAYIKPRLSLKIYGTVAPYLDGELYGRIDADINASPWWSLYGGVDIGAGVKMEIFGEELFDYYTDPPIITYEELIADANTVGNNQAPTVPSNPDPLNNSDDQPVDTYISWTCSDPDNDPLLFDVYFGATNPPTIAETSYSGMSYNPGTLAQGMQYYWKIVAKDDHTNQTEGPVWSFTTEGGTGDPCPGIPTFTYHGQTYNTVLIGSQCWMKENLNYEIGNSWCYNNNTSNCITYGRLYYWQTALIACPSGWHLPSDIEWKVLEGTTDSQHGVGSSEWDGIGYRGLDAGDNLKSAVGWSSGGNGANKYGFNGLPAGNRFPEGNYDHLSQGGHFWTSSESTGDDSWMRALYYGSNGVRRNEYDKSYGFSVRCVKD